MALLQVENLKIQYRCIYAQGSCGRDDPELVEIKSLDGLSGAIPQTCRLGRHIHGGNHEHHQGKHYGPKSSGRSQ